MFSSAGQLKNPAFYRKTIHIMIPVMVQQLITVGINFLDNIMIGSFGENPIAAASLGNQYYGLFQFICMGLGSGAIVLSAQYWGAGDRDTLKKVAAVALRLTGIVGAVFTALTVIWPDVILGIFTDNAAVVLVGTEYLRLIGITMILAGISSSVTYLLRSTGHVRIPLISSVIAFVLNLFFNWVFIFGMLGFPRLELVGAAVGTVIARVFEFLFIFLYFVLKDRNFGFRIRHFLLSDREIFRKYMRYGLPVLISDSLLGLGITLTSVIIGHVSLEMLAANSIVQSANQLLTVVNVGIGGAASVIIGNTIGEGKYDRAYQEGVAYCIVSVLLGVVLSLVIFLIQDPYLTLYMVSADTVQTAKSLFLCIMIQSPLQLLSYITSKGILRGGGDTRFLMVADVILLWVISLPFGYLAASVWHLSPFWIFFLLKLEFTLKGLICTARMVTRKWIKKVAAEPV